jgi:hypothetical protein
MIGDDIGADIGGAPERHDRDLEGPIKPDFVISSVAVLPALWESAAG